MFKYRFILYDGQNNRLCHPVYKQDLALEWAFESQQYFRRANLSGQLVFVGADFDWIMSKDFEQKIYVYLSVDWNDSGTWQNYWTGSFHQTDCTINYDDKKITVKPNVEDRYTKILAGMEKEYDLIKLTPAVQPVNMTRRPMLQIYSAGEEVVSCFLSSMAWEQECESVTDDNKLIDDYHFGQIGEYAEFAFGDNYFIGTVLSHGLDTGEWNDFGNNGTYQMNYFKQYITSAQDVVFRNGIRVYLNGTQTLIWEYYQDSTTGWQLIPSEFTLSAKRTGYSDQTTTQTVSKIYGRWCVAANLTDCYPIAQDDIVTYNRNYKYCKPYSGDNIVTMNYEMSTTPTQWGINNAGKYYKEPTNDTPYAKKYFPISRSTWGNASLWYIQTDTTRTAEEALRVPTVLRDAFTIEAVIKALLNQIDSGLRFDGTSTYSQFLFGSNPLLNNWGRLVISPKSNVLVAEYTQPSQKAPITLAEVLKMLRDACGCYWFIDSSNRLRIEHISYFKNGGSYSGVPSVGIDLTTLYNSRNGKTWDFGTNEVTFEKLDMAQRYEYSWMDDTTEAFKGYPIEIISTYVEQDKIEEITVAGFNPDIDYMMLNPSMVSEDGFALMCCQVSGGQYNVPISYVVDILNICQNYQLTMMMLQAYFLRSDLSAWHVKINQNTTIAWGIQRKKEQKVNIPLGEAEPELQKLVKTGIGNGEVKSLSINLSSRMAQATLMYNTTEWT